MQSNGVTWIKISTSVPMLSTRTRPQRISLEEKDLLPMVTLEAGSDTVAH